MGSVVIVRGDSMNLYINDIADPIIVKSYDHNTIFTVNQNNEYIFDINTNTDINKLISNLKDILVTSFIIKNDDNEIIHMQSDIQLILSSIHEHFEIDRHLMQIRFVPIN